MRSTLNSDYGMATITRLLQIIGIFCRISSLLKGFFAKEKVYNFKEPTSRSHPTCRHDSSERRMHSTLSADHAGMTRLKDEFIRPIDRSIYSTH